MKQINNKTVYVSMPENIVVHEYKAPTDASIVLMEEMHEKAMKNIIAHVRVEDNLVSGEAFCFDRVWEDDFQLLFKLKINGQDFTIQRSIKKLDLLKHSKDLNGIQSWLKDGAKSVMLWYVLKLFTASAYEQLCGKALDDEVIKDLIS